MNSEILVKLVTMPMPYGKYKGRKICDLPEHYVVWYHTKGFPKGELGMLLNTLYEIKLNGLEYLLRPIKQKVRELEHRSAKKYKLKETDS